MIARRMTAMPRALTLNVPDDLYEALVRIAGRTRQTPEQLAEGWLAAGVKRFDEDPLLNLAGCVEAPPDVPVTGDPAEDGLNPGPGLAESPQGSRVG
jgi:hypothetical protein